MSPMYENFDAERSLEHLNRLRRQVASLKGEKVEGLTSLEKENEPQIVSVKKVMKSKAKEIN